MRNLFKLSTLTLTALVMSTTMALAGMSVEDAKQQGLIGERTDGTLGIVSSATPDVKALVSETNQERLEKYKKIAAGNGTGLSQVQNLAGKKLIEAAGSGEYVQSPSGAWVKK